MLHLLQILNLIFHLVLGSRELDSREFGGDLVGKLRNDVNLDLSEDEEYEDLRAEFLAYHSALASLTSTNGRRSMVSTPCWALGGICINYKLCKGFTSLSQVPGCKDKLKVCCFAWNRYNVRDLAHEGIGTLGFPWSLQEDFGKGQGVVVKEIPKKRRIKKSSKPRSRGMNAVALVLYK